MRLHNLIEVNAHQFDWLFSADYLISQLVFIGISYRYLGTSGIQLGIEKTFQLDKTQLRFDIGYANEYAWNYASTSAFSHEIFTSLSIFLERKKGKKQNEEANINSSRYYRNSM